MRILRTETPVTTSIATVALNEDCVLVDFSEFIVEFKDVVNSYGYRWDCENKDWRLPLGMTTEDPVDRVVETALLLLDSNISVMVDEKYLALITNFEYKPVCRHWIMKLDTNYLVTMPYGDAAFIVVRSIYGSRYSTDYKGVVVPVSRFSELRDFADQYSFQISPAALRSMDEQERMLSGAIVITARLRQDAKKTKEAPQGIDKGLLDNDI